MHAETHTCNIHVTQQKSVCWHDALPYHSLNLWNCVNRDISRVKVRCYLLVYVTIVMTNAIEACLGVQVTNLLVCPD